VKVFLTIILTVCFISSGYAQTDWVEYVSDSSNEYQKVYEEDRSSPVKMMIVMPASNKISILFRPKAGVEVHINPKSIPEIVNEQIDYEKYKLSLDPNLFECKRASIPFLYKKHIVQNMYVSYHCPLNKIERVDIFFLSAPINLKLDRKHKFYYSGNYPSLVRSVTSHENGLSQIDLYNTKALDSKTGISDYMNAISEVLNIDNSLFSFYPVMENQRVNVKPSYKHKKLNSAYINIARKDEHNHTATVYFPKSHHQVLHDDRLGYYFPPDTISKSPLTILYPSPHVYREVKHHISFLEPFHLLDFDNLNYVMHQHYGLDTLDVLLAYVKKDRSHLHYNLTLSDKTYLVLSPRDKAGFISKIIPKYKVTSGDDFFAVNDTILEAESIMVYSDLEDYTEMNISRKNGMLLVSGTIPMEFSKDYSSRYGKSQSEVLNEMYTLFGIEGEYELSGTAILFNKKKVLNARASFSYDAKNSHCKFTIPIEDLQKVAYFDENRNVYSLAPRIAYTNSDTTYFFPNSLVKKAEGNTAWISDGIKIEENSMMKIIPEVLDALGLDILFDTLGAGKAEVSSARSCTQHPSSMRPYNLLVRTKTENKKVGEIWYHYNSGSTRFTFNSSESN